MTVGITTMIIITMLEIIIAAMPAMDFTIAVG